MILIWFIEKRNDFMDLKNLNTFLRAAELGSITKAAEELNYVQSTVTSQIQQLEKELGFPLFDRIGKRISLTAPGKEFVVYANEILHITQKIKKIGSEPGEICGNLRIGVLESLLYSTMMQILPAFKKLYRNVDIQVQMGQSVELVNLLKQNQLDLVYISGNLNCEPDLHSCYARRESLVFIAAPNHPLAMQRRVSIPELLKYDFLVTERSGICYGRLTELAAPYPQPLHYSLVVDSTVAITRLVSKGMGIAFLPEYSIAEQLETGKIIKIDTALEPQTYYSQLLYHKSKWLSPFMEDFIRLVREYRSES